VSTPQPAASVESLYRELHQMAERCMRGQPADHTLQATALVHEAYLRMAGDGGSTPEHRAQFLVTAAKAMRHVLVDHARARASQKRTPPGSEVPLDRIFVAYESRALDLVVLDDTLTRLQEFDPGMAQAVELRFFGGLSLAECATCLGVTRRVLERRWVTVRAWLHAQMR